MKRGKMKSELLVVLQELNEEILIVNQKVASRNRLRTKINRILGHINQEKKRLDGLKIKMQKEFADVEKLESINLSSLILKIKGSIKEQYNKEQQEYYAVRLQYNQCKHSIEKLENDVIELRDKLAVYSTVDDEYKALLLKKDKLLKQHHDVKVEKFSVELTAIQTEKTEISEAISAGDSLLEEMNKLVKILNKARGWGVFDLFGGGLIATAVKHSKINQAQEIIHHVQYLLNKFQDELKDINLSSDTLEKIELGSFSQFADYFFDGLIVDWIVQAKIKKSYDSSKQLLFRVNLLVKGLRKRYELLEKDRNVLRGKYKQYVESVS